VTPADEINAAATRLRALTANPQLTPGPWLSMDHGDRVLWDGEGAEDQAPVYVVDEPMSNGANADYRATMHPNVGLALAVLLEGVLSSNREAAPAHEECTSWCSADTCDLSAALAVARAILGDQP
jgi:hypothetical protein